MGFQNQCNGKIANHRAFFGIGKFLFVAVVFYFSLFPLSLSRVLAATPPLHHHLPR